MLHELDRRLLDEVVFGVGGHEMELQELTPWTAELRIPQLDHHVVEGVTRPSFGAASVF
jgi:nicotinamide mononucleotide adenylyltransferase